MQYLTEDHGLKATVGKLIVAAIDFGTTFSSWAFAFYHEVQCDPPKIHVKHWNSGQNISEKAPTVVLIKPDGKTFHSFGYEAENKYAELAADDEHDGWHYFRRFKMKLFPGVNLKRDVLLEDDQGHKLPAKTIFRMAIQYLREDMMKTANEKLTGTVKEEDVYWVITVPAIWNDATKQFMREAAVEAGMCNKRLQIALEPEAASIYCRTVPISQYEGFTVSPFQKGARYIVFDAGGGTVDITVHEVGEEENLKELHHVSGGAWGGTKVDDALKKLLTDIFGEKVIARFEKECREDYLELFRIFEIKKRKVEAGSEAKITFPVHGLPGIVSAEKHIGLKDALLLSEHKEHIKCAGDAKLRFSPELMQNLFAEVLHSVLSHLKDLLMELTLKSTDVKTVLLVGGFSECKILQEAIRGKFPKLALAVPSEAGVAVLKGAVLFGHRPNTITARICKYSYGFGAVSPFEKGKHEKRYHVDVDGREMCVNIYKQIIAKGKSLHCGKEKSKECCWPIKKGDDHLSLTFYAATDNNITYVTDERCQRLCKILLDINDKEGPPKDRPFEVVIDFSGTQINIEATETRTGKLTRTSVDFLG